MSWMSLFVFMLSLLASGSVQAQIQGSTPSTASGWIDRLVRKCDSLLLNLDERLPQLRLRSHVENFLGALNYPPNKYFIEATYHSLVYKDVYYPKEHVLPGEFYNSPYGSFANTQSGKGMENKTKRPTHLGSQIISPAEIVAMEEVRALISQLKASINSDSNNNDSNDDDNNNNNNKEITKIGIVSFDQVSPWLWSCTDIDIIRFLRKHANNVKKTFMNIVTHAKWRVSYPNGADHIIRENAYEDNIKLHEEVFWLDSVDKNGCPTVVVRALLHDGENYDEIPQKFTNFLVYQLEKSRNTLGVGSNKMACLVLDRFPVLSKNGAVKSQEIFDLSIVPNVISLLRNIVETMQDNYPEMFDSITVSPASWFFQTCFRFSKKVFEKKIQDRFHLVPEDDAVAYLDDLFTNGELTKRILPKSSSNNDDISNIKANNLSNNDAGENSSSSWISNLITVTLLETSIYFIWQTKEYLSCYYMHDTRRCSSSGGKFQKVRSKDVMTF